MGEAKRRKAKSAAIELPIAEHDGISATDVFPTLAAMWEDFTQKPFFAAYSRETRQVLKFAFYRAVSESLRTVAFRMNSEGSDAVFDDLDREIRAFDRELADAFAAH